MELEGVMFTEVNQTKTNAVCFHLIVESKKIKQMNKYNKTETDSLLQRTNYWLPVRRGGGQARY